MAIVSEVTQVVERLHGPVRDLSVEVLDAVEIARRAQLYAKYRERYLELDNRFEAKVMDTLLEVLRRHEAGPLVSAHFWTNKHHMVLLNGHGQALIFEFENAGALADALHRKSAINETSETDAP